MNMKNHILIRVLVALGMVVSSSAGWAQAISGDLVGTVVDASGAAVPNATVDAINTGTGVKSTGQSNAAGQYRISNLLAGTYRVTVSATGFSQSTVDGVAV